MGGRPARALGRNGFLRGNCIRAPGPIWSRGGKRLRGQASLEILIVLIFLLPLIFGAIELSRGVAVRASLDSGVGAAVRALAIDPTQWSWSANVVAQAVAQNVFGDAGLGTVHFEAYDSSGTQLTSGQFAALSYGAPFCLVGWVDYSPVIPLISLSPSSITIRVQHCGVVERIN
jgi:Flp pilus assembly protein TadG